MNFALLDAIRPQRGHNGKVRIESRAHEGSGFDLDDIAAWHVGFAAVFQSGQCPASFARKDNGADHDAAPLGIIHEEYLLAKFARMTEGRLARRRSAFARSNGMLRRSSDKRTEFGKDASRANVNPALDFFPVEEVFLQRVKVHFYHTQTSVLRLPNFGIRIQCFPEACRPKPEAHSGPVATSE